MTRVSLYPGRLLLSTQVSVERQGNSLPGATPASRGFPPKAKQEWLSRGQDRLFSGGPRDRPHQPSRLVKQKSVQLPPDGRLLKDSRHYSMSGPATSMRPCSWSTTRAPYASQNLEELGERDTLQSARLDLQKSPRPAQWSSDTAPQGT